MDHTLYRTLFRWKCTSTHHKLAVDALRHLRHPKAAAWRDVFLGRIEPYLQGSKAPDNTFKDFRNHVLHIADNGWGGAPATSLAWYAKTLAAFRAKKWNEAVYNAGVLSHYVTDVVQPFHTGQTEAEGAVHRAAEWSIACGYLELQDLLEDQLGGYPDVKLHDGPDWLTHLVCDGASVAHPHYQPLIDHYNLAVGKKKPVEGMDQEFRNRIAPLLGFAAVAFARVLDRVIEESEVEPPRQGTLVLGLLAKATIPLFAVTQSRFHAKERAVVRKIAAEFEATGKVIQALPDDEREIRRLHAEEVRQISLDDLAAEKPKPPGTAYVPFTPPEPAVSEPNPETDEAPKVVASAKTAQAPREEAPRLHESMPVEKAPSIGSKTAKYLGKIGIRTVGDLLMADPETSAEQMGQRHITGDDLWAWQLQARFCCEVPGLFGHDAQILVGAGVGDRADLARCDAADLFQRVQEFVATSEGQSVLRDGQPPDLAEIQGWIAKAQTNARQAA